MKTLKLLLIFLLFAECINSQSTDDVVIAKKLKIHSVVLGEDETIFVSTPNSYSSTNNSYPVLYILDGSEVEISFVGGLVKNLSDYEVIPEMIVVAIATNDRKRDYTPTMPQNRPADFYKRIPHAGEADKFLSYVATELFPYIEKNYRTLPYRILAGHSDPGLCVVHTFLTHTNMFDSYIASSPSLGWDSCKINKVAEERISTINLKKKQFFICISGKENPSSISDVNSFTRILRLKAPAELKWKFNYYADEDHYSEATIALYDGIRFIYDGWKFDADLMLSRGVDYIKNFYQSQSDKFGYEIKPQVFILNMIGKEMLRSSRQDEALKVFNYSLSIYPKSPEAFSSLGSCYLQTGNKDAAIKNIEKAVELATDLKDENLDRYKSQLEDAKSNKK